MPETGKRLRASGNPAAIASILAIVAGQARRRILERGNVNMDISLQSLLSDDAVFAPVYRVTLSQESSVYIGDRPKMAAPDDVARVCREVVRGEWDREHLYVLLLDTKGHVIGVNLVAVGCLNSASVHPREIFKPAVVHSADSIIVAHNHPSEDPTPSDSDRALTRELIEAGKLMQIGLRDHVVFTQRDFYSLRGMEGTAFQFK